VVQEILLLAVSFAAGLAVQRARPSDRFRARAWTSYFWTMAPVLVFYSFSTVTFDRRLALALVAAIVATWIVAGLGYAYAALVAEDRAERGALALCAGFPNTGFVGYPLAQIAFGNPGLALAVIYDRLAWLVPATAISTTVARLHGRRERIASPRARIRAALANPPLIAAATAITLRLTGLDLGVAVTPLGHAAGAAVGPAGFFLLGLALPLDAPAHDARELRRAGGVLLIRFALAPLVLAVCGLALGASIPAAFYLAAAMPCAFHLLILARVFDVRPQLVRLLVVASTVPAVAAVVAGTALFR
jgi:predicted permease